MSGQDLAVKQIAGVRSALYPYNLFVYNSYWGSWSRVLRFMQHAGKSYVAQVEVNLTAINPWESSGWDKVRAITIREHGTSRDRKDKYTAELPEVALEYMRERLDAPLIERLLHEDFLPRIDWDKYRRLCNGGCPFHLCMKTE